MTYSKKPKALVLFSGGLDSMLVVKILESQGIKTSLISFTSFFFNANQAKNSAKILGKKLKIVDISQKHLRVVLDPKHGYGQGLNPCTDCHLLMIKEAKKILKKEGMDFMATGEVVGQRPMSQKIHHLKLIERKAGLKDKILRPLSAKVLEETEIEKMGLVDREKLLAISGRSRKEQISLMKKLKIKEYPSPAGGCILTDLNFAKRLKEFLKNKKGKTSKNEIELLRIGRHLTKHGARIVIGRNHEENLKIKKLAEKKDILMELKKITGPLVIIRIEDAKKARANKDKILNESAKLAKHYSIKARELDSVEIKYWNKGNKINFKILKI